MNRLKLKYRIWFAATTFVLVTTATYAAEGEHREHRAHEHGRGVLNVVVEGNELVIELEIPGVNVVGFEHEPGTEKERHAVEVALETFAKANALFVPSTDAQCRAEGTEVELAGMQHEEGEQHAGEHSEHESKSGHAEHEEDAHSELHAQYVFHCDAPDALESLEVRLFDHLRDVEEIDVQLVTPTIQTAMELHMTSAVLQLARR